MRLSLHVALVRRLTALCFAGAFVAACVGDAPTDTPTGDDGGSNDSGGDGADLRQDSSTKSDGSLSGDADAPSDASSANETGADAALDADSGPYTPTITCATQATGAAFYFTKAASIAPTTVGGAIQIGSYTLMREWDGAGGKVEGSATVLQQGADLFLQFYSLPMGGTAVYGTKWMQPDGAGGLKMTELCRAGFVGTVETGTYEMRLTTNPTELYINYGVPADRQEKYTHD